MDYILPWLWVQFSAISWIVITATETVKTITEQVSRLITDNVIADTMGNAQRNAYIYMGQLSLQAAMIHMRFAGDKITNLNYTKALSPSLREEWVTLKGTLF